MSQKPLILIAAVAATNNGIGVENGLPWRLRKELAYFTKATKTVVAAKQPHDDDSVPLMNACIMGRNTWEGIPPKYRPFDQRYNI
ncbi:dihydrofolate reductase, partial [Coemansia erecta]